MKRTEVELAWAAGFFDGEGHSRAQGTKRSPRKYLQLHITQTDRQVLDRFDEAVGVSGVRGPYMSKGRIKPLFYWRVTGKKAVEVFESLRPYLSEIKIAQADAALADIREQLEEIGQPDQTRIGRWA